MTTLLWDALQSFGLSKPDQQIAMIENMFLEGLFEQEVMWNCLHKMPREFGPNRPVSPIDIFEHFVQVLEQARAYNKEQKFDARIVLDNLCPAADVPPYIDREDMQNIVAALKQEAGLGSMERYQLPGFNPVSQYKENLKLLGISLDEVLPEQGATYDKVIIPGASRYKMEERVDWLLKVMKEQGMKPEEIVFLSGRREVHIPFDSIGGDGAFYLSKLADDQGIPYANSGTIVPHSREEQVMAENTKKNLPKRQAFYEQRAALSFVRSDKDKEYYFHYTNPGGRTLQEADIARDIAERLPERAKDMGMAIPPHQVRTIATDKVDPRNNRATFALEALEFAEVLIAEIEAGKFLNKAEVNVALAVEAPYGERMLFEMQRIVLDRIDEDKKMHQRKAKEQGIGTEEQQRHMQAYENLSNTTITITRIGKEYPSNSKNMGIPKAESAAITAEQYRKMVAKENKPRRHSADEVVGSQRDPQQGFLPFSIYKNYVQPLREHVRNNPQGPLPAGVGLIGLPTGLGRG